MVGLVVESPPSQLLPQAETVESLSVASLAAWVEQLPELLAQQAPQSLPPCPVVVVVAEPRNSAKLAHPAQVALESKAVEVVEVVAFAPPVVPVPHKPAALVVREAMAS